MLQMVILAGVVVLAGCGKKEEASPPQPQSKGDGFAVTDGPSLDGPTAVDKIPNPTKVIPKISEWSAAIEEAIRNDLNKPKGELTTTDLERVKFLNLYDPEITDTDLKEMHKLKQLSKIYLHCPKITDAGLKEVSKLKQLSWLDLRRTQITDAGLKELAKLKQLSELYLKRTPITDEGLKEIANLKKLSYLALENTKVTKAGVAQLQKVLPNCTIAQ